VVTPGDHNATRRSSSGNSRSLAVSTAGLEQQQQQLVDAYPTDCPCPAGGHQSRREASGLISRWRENCRKKRRVWNC
jgi:hypothetical protein